jgi:hypothetical protein
MKAVRKRQAVERPLAAVELFCPLPGLLGHLPFRHALPAQLSLLNSGQSITVQRGIGLRLPGIGPQNPLVLLNP